MSDMSEDRRKEEDTIGWSGWGEEPAQSRFRRGRLGFGSQEKSDERDREWRPGRLFTVFKALVLLVLLGVTAYGMINQGGYTDIRWVPVAAGSFALVFITLFIRGFYADIPAFGWYMVVALGALVGIKALSMTWTLSQSDTIMEVMRSSMYLAFFLLALAALSSERQVAPMMDIAVLIVVAIAGYGLLQKVSPVQYPVLSLDGVRVDSTLGYSNTTATVLGMGVALALARITSSGSFLLRGVYSAFIVGFLACLYLTVSRGGIGSLLIALALMLLITGNRLQTIGNLTLAGVPFLYFLWQIQGLNGIFISDVPEGQKLADGLALRQELIIAMVLALVLQVFYTFVVRRYELMPFGRRAIGLGLAAATGLVAVVGAVLVVIRYGGIGQTVSALSQNPILTDNSVDRLTSLSLGTRLDYWRIGIDYWRDNLLTGGGAGTFNIVWARFRTVESGVQQIHNVYLEQGVETGIFAFIAILVFAVGVTVYSGVATWRSYGLRRVLLAGLFSANLVYLVSSFIEWHWYIPPATVFYFIIAGMMLKYASSPGWSEAPDDTSPLYVEKAR